ncbi:hypothetical protein TWF730_002384 [Orbilia blumenaviensis]|uniref:PHD-type domain-containing protein n=1 Tax=Orbilia blumenaviensis TaxID=1796055 RepID=A0AAV9UCQ9_9PEZI
MAPQGWISNDIIYQSQRAVTKEGSNVSNAIVIDDDDGGDQDHAGSLRTAGFKPATIILDLTEGSATPPASNPSVNVTEPQASEPPAEIPQATYTLSWGTHALLAERVPSPTINIVNEELPDTAVNSTILSLDNTTSQSQERNNSTDRSSTQRRSTDRLSPQRRTAERPSPQRQSPLAGRRERNRQTRAGSTRRNLDDDETWEGNINETPFKGDWEAEKYCKNGREVLCPGQNGVQPHRTIYGAATVDGTPKYGCFPEVNEFGCGNSVSGTDYRRMVIATQMRDYAGKLMGTISSMEGEDVLEPSNAAVAATVATTVVDHDVEDGGAGKSLMVRTSEAAVDKLDLVLPTPVDDPVPSPSLVDDSSAASKPTSNSLQDTVEPTSAEEDAPRSGSRTSEPPTELEPEAAIESFSGGTPPVTCAELTQTTELPPISPGHPPPPTLSTNKNSPLPSVSLLEATFANNSINYDDPHINTLNPLDSPLELLLPPTIPEQEATMMKPSRASTPTPIDVSVPETLSSEPKDGGKLLPPTPEHVSPSVAENSVLPPPPVTRSSTNHDVCAACRQAKSILSADHPVKCQICKRAWHRTCNADIRDMGYNVTSWTCRSCVSRKRSTRSRHSGNSSVNGSGSRRGSRQSSISSGRKTDSFHGLGPKRRDSNNVKRVSSNSPSITLATPATAVQVVNNEILTTEVARPEKVRHMGEEVEKGQEECWLLPESPAWQESSGGALSLLDKWDPVPVPIAPILTPSRRKRRRKRSHPSASPSIEVEVEKRPVQPRKRCFVRPAPGPSCGARRGHVSPTAEPEPLPPAEGRDETLVFGLEEPSTKRLRREGPSIMVDEQPADEESIVNGEFMTAQEPMVIEDLIVEEMLVGEGIMTADEPMIIEEPLSIEEPVAIEESQEEMLSPRRSGYAIAGVMLVEPGALGDADTDNEESGIADLADGSKSPVPDDQTPSSANSKLGKFRPLPKLSLMRLSNRINNSGTTLEPPRSQEPETPTTSEGPAAGLDTYFPAASGVVQNPLSPALTNEGAPLPMDMPCDISSLEKPRALIQLPRIFDTEGKSVEFGEDYRATKTRCSQLESEVKKLEAQLGEPTEIQERYRAQSETLDSYKLRCSTLEGEVASSLAQADRILQRLEDQQAGEAEKLRTVNERCERYRVSADEAKEECEELKRRIETLEKQIESRDGSAESASELQGQLAHLQLLYDGALRELGKPGPRVVELMQYRSRCETLQKKFNKASEDYKQLVRETEGQAGKLEAAETEKESLSRSLEETTTYLNEARKECQDANQELCRVTERYEMLERGMASLGGRPILPYPIPKQPYGRMGTRGDIQHSDVLRQNERLREEKAKLEESRRTLEAQCSASEQKIGALSEEVRAVREDNQKLGRLRRKTEAQIPPLRAQLRDACRVRDQKIKELEENSKKDVEIKRLQDLNREAKYAMECKVAEFKSLEATFVSRKVLNEELQAEIRSLEEKAQTAKKDFDDQLKALNSTHSQEVRELKLENERLIEQSRREEEAKARAKGSEEQLELQKGVEASLLERLAEKTLREETSKSEVKDLEDELKRRKDIEDILRERLEASELRYRELEKKIGGGSNASTLEAGDEAAGKGCWEVEDSICGESKASSPSPSAKFEFDFPFTVTHPMLPEPGFEVDAVGELPKGHRVRTTQSRKERYESWYHRNPKALHLHRSCKRDLPVINGKVRVFEADGTDCNSEEDKCDLKGRLRKRGNMAFDEFIGVHQNDVVPVSVQGCSKVTFRKVEKNLRTGGLSRHAVIYRTGRNVPGELRA